MFEYLSVLLGYIDCLLSYMLIFERPYCTLVLELAVF